MPTKVAGATPYIYLASAATSILGNAVASIVWPWMVLEKTGNPAAAGIVATCITVPSTLSAAAGLRREYDNEARTIWVRCL